MSNSSLVNVTIKTKHFGYPTGKAGRGGAKIDKIFVHHTAGILTAEQIGNVFKSREASAHYGIDGKGRIGLYVDESNAAWHCANKSYNQRSIGIELSNDGGAKTNWHVSDKAISKCIDLIVDICKRNGIKKINYTGDLKGNLCMHQWTASTSCPGPYLKTKFKYIAEQVNKKLGSSATTNTPAKAPATTGGLYRVRKSWDDVKSQVGAYKVLANAKKAADQKGLNVYDEKGTLVYQGKKKESLIDKEIAACKEQADWMKNYTYKWQNNPTIPKSKKYGTCVTYVACVLQRIGILKSGQYVWIDNKGKVEGANSKMTVTYPKGTLKLNKSKLKRGDIVIGGNGKVGAGQGSHIFVITGKWDGDNPYIYDQDSAGRVKKGKKPEHTWNGNFKMIALIKLK